MNQLNSRDFCIYLLEILDSVTVALFFLSNFTINPFVFRGSGTNNLEIDHVVTKFWSMIIFIGYQTQVLSNDLF
jgi:hypothetical protein